MLFPKTEFERGIRMGRKAFVCEGDSWFENKSRLKSIPYVLRTNRLGGRAPYTNLNYASGGDWARDVAENLDRSLDALSKYSRHRLNFALSAGGNDLLDQANLERILIENPGGDFDAIDPGGFAAFGQELSDSVLSIFRRVNETSPGIPIFWNGYDYPVASNIGIRFFLFQLAGPWIYQPLHDKGYHSVDEKRDVVRQIVDAFFSLQEEIVLEFRDEGGLVHLVDLRGVVQDEADWGDEIHPSSQAIVELSRAYRAQVDEFARYPVA